MKIVTILLSVSLLSLSSVQADETKVIEKQILEDIIKNTKVTASPIKNANLAKCFDAIFYEAEVKTGDKNGWMTQTDIYAKTPKGFQKVSLPSTNADMPKLLALIQPAFKLKTEADGKTMQAALKTLYTKRFKKDHERIVQNGTTWEFITDDFFKKFSGFVIVTDDEGKITSIARSLQIEGKSE